MLAGTIEVDPIATAPTLTTSATTIDETGSSTSHLQVTVTNAADVFESGDSVSVTISGLPSGTVLTQGGTAITADGSGNFTVTATAQTGLDNIQVTPPSEFEGTINYTLSATTTDTATGPSGALSNTSSPATVLAGTIEVDPIATAPTLTTSATTIDETGSSTSHLQVTVTNAADVFESGDSVSVTISGLPSGTVLTQGGTAITADGSGNFTVTATAQTGLDNIQVTPPSEFEGTINYTLSATTTDTATGPSGALSNTSSPATVLAGTIEVDPIATAPTLTTSATTIDETGSSTSHLQVTVTNAADVFESGNSVSVTISGLPSGTVLTQGGTAITADGSGNFTVTATAQTGLDNIQVTPPSEFEGTINYTLSATTTDTATGPSGALSNTSSPATVLAGTIEVDPIATAPTAAVPTTLAVNENASNVAVTDGTNFVTVGPLKEDGDDTVSVQLAVTHGTLNIATLAGVTESAQSGASLTLSGDAALVNSVLHGLSYTPGSEYEGSDTLNVTVTSIDGSNTYPTTTSASTTITVNPIAAAPTAAAPSTLAVNENASNVAVTDGTNFVTVGPLKEDGDDTVSVQLAVTHGTLNIATLAGVTESAQSGASLTLSGDAALVNSVLHGLSYTPGSEYEGSDTLNVTVTSIDGSNTYPTTTSASTTITVNPIAAAPTAAAPATLSMNENASNVAVTDGTNFVTVGPLKEDGDDTVSVQLAVTHGTLNIATLAGVTESAQSGSSLTLSGDAALVNSVLHGLSYTPTAQYVGSDTLNVTTTSIDGSNTYPTTTSASTAIAVNNETVTATNATVATPENVQKTGTVTASGDTDSDVSFTAVTESTTQGGSVTISANGNFTYTPASGFSGTDTFSFTAHDESSSPSGTETVTVVAPPAISAPQGGSTASGFTTIDYPGAYQTNNGTFAYGINNSGVFVGGAATDSQHTVGWKYNGSFTTIIDGGAQDNNADGINNSGEIGGFYAPVRSTPRYGFTDVNGTFTQIASDSPYPSTTVNGLNDSGVLVGASYLHNTGSVTPQYSGFIDNNGVFTYLDAPGTLTSTGYTVANGINNAGQVVGTFSSNNSTVADQGFLYQNSSFTTINDPNGAKGTVAMGINNSSEIVGYYIDGSGAQHGFIDIGGTFATIDDPLGKNTIVTGINDTGQIVGYYQDNNNTYHGFVASLNNVTTAENTPLTLTSLSVSDAFTGANSITVTLAVGHGILTLGNTSGLTTSGLGSSSVSLTGSVSAIDAALASGLTYTPTTNFVFTDTLSITANDLGHNTSGVALSSTQIVGIVVDNETVAPSTLSMNENASNVAVTDGTNFVTVGPLKEDGDDTVSVQLAVTHGTLNVATLAGVTESAQSGSSLTLSGDAALVNSVLTGLTYTPTGEYEGADTLNVTTTSIDGSNTNPTTTSASTSITVNPIAEAPTAAAPATLSMNENASNVAVTDGTNFVTVGPLKEDGDDTVSVQLAVTHGTLNIATLAGVTESAQSGASLTLSGDAALVNSVLHGLSYTPGSEYEGADTLNVTVTSIDGSNTYPTTTSASTTITVNPIATAPTAAAPSTLSGERERQQCGGHGRDEFCDGRAAERGR